MNSFDRFCAAPIGEYSGLELLKVSSASKKALEALPDSEFALPIRNGIKRARRLPMSTPDMLIKSSAWLVECGYDDLPEQMVQFACNNMIERYESFGMQPPEPLTKMSGAKKLSQSHLYWTQVEEDWEKFEEVNAPVEKVSSPKEDLPVLHAFSIEGVDQPFKLRSLEDVYRLDQYLSKHSSVLSSNDKRHAARQLMVALEKLDFDTTNPDVLTKLSSDTRDWAGKRIRPEVRTLLLNDRLPYFKSSHYSILPQETRQKVSAAYKALASSVSDCKSVDDFEKLAAAIDELDRNAGIHEDVMPAHRVVFLGIGERMGDDLLKKSEDDDVIYTGGQTMIREAHLKQLPFVNAERLEGFLGEEVVEELRKDPVTIFKSLPKPHQRMVARFVEEMIVIHDRTTLDQGLT